MDFKKRNFIIVIVIAILFILVGFGLLYFYNSKRVISKALDDITTTFKNKYLMNYDINTNFDDFTVESDIKFNIKSDYFQQIAQFSPNYLVYANLINNLNKTNSKLVFKQDKTNQKLFINLDSQYNNESLINMKYLIENNTEYYYIKGFLDSYINNGTSNYFEALHKNTTNKENIEYVYGVAINSFKKNLKSEYFTKSGEKVVINGKEKSLQKITLEVNNDRLVELATSILNDLKNDEKAMKILTGIDNEFKNAKITSSSKFLDDKQKIVFSVYVDNLTYIIKKYKIDFVYGNDITTITYEKNKQSILNFYRNNILESSSRIEYNKNETIMYLSDGNKKALGKIKINKSDNSYKIDFSIDIESIQMNFLLQQDITNIKKDKSYDSKIILNGNIVSNNISLASIGINCNSKVTNGAKIEENTDNAVFAKDINDNQKLQLNQYITNIFSRLMS